MAKTLSDRNAQFGFRCLCIAILTVVFFTSSFAGIVQIVDCPSYECLKPNSDHPVNPIVRTLIKWERSLQYARHYLVGTPELETAMVWIQRTHMVDIRDWYNTDRTTMTPYPDATPLSAGMQPNGRIVYPLHALYLYAIGAVVRSDAAKLIEEDFTWAMFPMQALSLRANIAFYSGLAMFLCISLAALPVLWRLADLIAGLLLDALVGREQCEATETSPTALVVAKMSEDAKAAVRRRITFVTALAGFAFGLLPAFVIDIAAITPNTLALTLLLCAFYLFARDEITMHPARDFVLEDFDMTHPVLEQGRLRFYALKKSISRKPLILAATCTAAACMLQSSFVSLAPLLCLWVATSCYQHGFQRVAVMMSGTDGAADKGQETPMGFSCYRDRMKINEWFSYTSVCAVGVVIACMAPFCYGKMNFFDFIDLFARPSDKDVSASLSVSGAKEMFAECLTSLSQFFRCTRAVPNLWRIVEFSGVPLTRVFTDIASPFAKSKSGPTHSERQLWLDYASIVMLVLLHSASILALLLYRTRKPPLTFSAPSAYQAMHVEQLAEYHEYLKRAALKRGQPQVAARKDRDAAKKAPPRPAKTVTCISREEYVLKQISMLAWMALISVTSTTLFLGSPAYMHFVPVLGPVAVLVMMHIAVGALRRVSPTVFELFWERPIPSTTTATPETAPAAPAGPSISDESLEAVPLTTRWCSTSSAAISEKADLTWMLAVVLAVVRCSEVFTFQWFPFHVQTVWALSIAVALQMIATRFWRRVDVVTTWFVVIAQFGAIALMFYAAQDYAQVMQKLPPGTSVSDRATAFLRKFVPFAVSRVVPLESVKESAPYPTGVVHLNYECSVAAVLLLGALVHAIFRVARLGLGPEELRFVPIEQEMEVMKPKTD